MRISRCHKTKDFTPQCDRFLMWDKKWFLKVDRKKNLKFSRLSLKVLITHVQIQIKLIKHLAMMVTQRIYQMIYITWMMVNLFFFSYFFYLLCFCFVLFCYFFYTVLFFGAVLLLEFHCFCCCISLAHAYFGPSVRI